MTRFFLPVTLALAISLRVSAATPVALQSPRSAGYLAYLISTNPQSAATALSYSLLSTVQSAGFVAAKTAAKATPAKVIPVKAVPVVRPVAAPKVAVTTAKLPAAAPKPATLVQSSAPTAIVAPALIGGTSTAPTSVVTLVTAPAAPSSVVGAPSTLLTGGQSNLAPGARPARTSTTPIALPTPRPSGVASGN